MTATVEPSGSLRSSRQRRGNIRQTRREGGSASEADSSAENLKRFGKRIARSGGRPSGQHPVPAPAPGKEAAVRVNAARITTIGTCILLVGSLAAWANAQCDETFVSVKAAKQVRVSPTGGDDTANLQCAFDLGAALGPGASVRLAAGTFHAEQLVVAGFRGSIAGAGRGVTILHSPGYPVPIDRTCEPQGECFTDLPPSPTNRYPQLFSIIGDDVTLSDLSIVISGGYGTELYHYWGLNIEIFSSTLQVIGSNASVRIERVGLDAGYCCGWNAEHESFTGDAAGTAIVWTWSQPTYLTGTAVLVRDSVLGRGGSLFAYNLDRSRVTLSDSTLEGGQSVAVSDVKNSHVIVERNRLSGIDLWAGNLGTGVTNSVLRVSNNRFVGGGIVLEPRSVHNVDCKAINNTFTDVEKAYQFNGYPCLVAGR
jgi:hypothetical protein